MKNKSVPLFARIFFSMMLSLATSAAVFAYPSGAPAGYTGSPGDGMHCVNCHGGSAVTVSGWITSNIPSQGYTAGSVYTITVTVSGSGKKGFEVSPQNATGTQLGILAAGTNNHLTGGTKYVTQNSAGSTSSTVSWSFTWTAPVSGTGTVTFYGACIVGKSNTKLTTMVASEDGVIPLAVAVTANPSTILPGTTSQLNAAASGGSGTYSYAWTSVPAGFTSNLQNPVVSPAATTQYTVTVNDGSGSTQGSTTVTVQAAPLTANATADPSVICAGQTSQLNVVPAGGSGSYTYSWTSVPAGFTSNLPNPVVTPSISTQYIAHVTDGTLSADAPSTVTVNQPATVFAGNDTTCAYVTTLVPLNGSGANFSSVLWTSSGTGTFSNAGAPAGNYFPSTADKTGGIVTLTLTAAAQSPCSATAVDERIIHFDAPTGISDAPGTRLIMTVSPNPSTGIFSLNVSGIGPEHTTVDISDIRGKTLLRQEANGSVTFPRQYDLTGFPKGLYLVKIQTTNQSMVRKLVIE